MPGPRLFRWMTRVTRALIPVTRTSIPQNCPGKSLEKTLQRVLPCWQEQIAPRLRRGERVLVVAHGNSLRALIKYLDRIPDQDVPGLSIPTGIPIAYDLDDNLEPIHRTYLGDPNVIRAAAEAAAKAAQVKGKKGQGYNHGINGFHFPHTGSRITVIPKAYAPNQQRHALIRFKKSQIHCIRASGGKAGRIGDSPAVERAARAGLQDHRRHPR